MQKNNCYVVFYKGERPFYHVKHAVPDFLIRKFTKSKYSHCEIAVQIKNSDSYLCFSSSFRDGGVRAKVITLQEHHWDFIKVNVAEDKLYEFFDNTVGMKYDLLGCLGILSRKTNTFALNGVQRFLGTKNLKK